MASPADAKTLESFAKAQMAPISGLAQLRSLGAVVNKIKLAVEGGVLRIRVQLTMEDVNQLLSVLDGRPTGEQGSPPQGAAPLSN